MRHRRSWGLVLPAASVIFLGLSPQAALATTLVLTSRAPYWDVGPIDPVLSQMCSTGQFNQQSVNQYIARFVGPEGPGVLGIAKGTGLNLVDPKHARKPTEDYFFLGDGSSSCAVYVGGRKPPPKPGDKNKTPAAKPGTTGGPTPPVQPNAAGPTPPTPPAGAPAAGTTP
jgi:hypothetical protein